MFAAVQRARRDWARLMQTGSYRAAGFTYVGLLVVVALFGLASVGAARILASTERAEREAELLFVGHQFRQAFRSYVQAGPGVRQYPATLEDLLFDKRFPAPRRHLRRLYADPITGKTQWGLVGAPEGGVMGVYSLSDREPLKRANFDPEDVDFVRTAQSAKVSAIDSVQYSYRDWQFVFRPAL